MSIGGPALPPGAQTSFAPPSAAPAPAAPGADALAGLLGGGPAPTGGAPAPGVGGQLNATA